MQQHGSGLLLGLLAHVEPEVVEEVHVALQLFFALVFGGGAADEAAGNSLAVRLQNALQTLAFFVGRNLAGDADVLDRRHVDDEPSGQSDVRGDARAFLPEGFFGDLNDDLLTLFEQVGDGGQRRAVRVPVVRAFGTSRVRASVGLVPAVRLFRRSRPPRSFAAAPRKSGRPVFSRAAATVFSSTLASAAARPSDGCFSLSSPGAPRILRRIRRETR